MFLMAGPKIPGTTLAYTLWELGKRPDIQAKLREEVQAYPGNPTYDEIMSSTALPYLDAVTKEAYALRFDPRSSLMNICRLRMFPALPYMERVAMRDDVLQLQTPITTHDGRTITALP